MLQKEFEERTKLSVTEEEFNGVNALYMACGDDIDKDVFCKLYISFDGRLELLHKIERNYQQAKEEIVEKNLLLDEAKEIRDDTADTVIQIEKDVLNGESEEHCAGRLNNLAFWLVGKRGVITRKVKQNTQLTSDEVDYVIGNLK